MDMNMKNAIYLMDSLTIELDNGMVLRFRMSSYDLEKILDIILDTADSVSLETKGNEQ